MGQRRHQYAAQAKYRQRKPHPEGQKHFGLAKDLHADGVEQSEQDHHAHAHHPGALLGGKMGVERFKIHQRHDPGEDGLRRAGKDMHDQIGAERAGDGEKAPHAAGDVVIHRSGGGDKRRGLGEGGHLRLHHNKGQQYRQGKGIAPHAETAGKDS